MIAGRLALAALLVATPAAAAVRTLFVGIDSYRYTAGKPGNRDPGFIDLGGSVGDVALLKSVLAKRWTLSLDATKAGDPCPTGASVSMTLLNDCATRAGIIAALVQQIAAAAPGDTLLFYYSGHGSQAVDRTGTQRDQLSGTIVPADGRGGTVNDILDTELHQFVAAALARGINFVTIADSCDSGSITRDLGGGQVRLAQIDTAPPTYVADVADAIARLPAARPGDAQPYEVMLAAADDGESARERGAAPDRHGVFTAALATALTELPTPSYADLAAEARRRLRDANEAQTPKFLGPLKTAFLSGQAASPRIFDTEIDAGRATATIAGGSLSGVTPGSSFALYAGRGAPASGAARLALAVVETARAGDATLKLASPVTNIGPLVAVEFEHAYSGQPIAIRIDGGTPAQQQRLQAVIAAYGFAPNATPTHVLAITGDSVHLFRASDPIDQRREIGTGYPASGANFEADTKATLQRIARFAAVLALRNDTGAAWGQVNVLLQCPGRDPAPLPLDHGVPYAFAGDILSIGYRNGSPNSLYPHMLALDTTTLEVNSLDLVADALPSGGSLRKITDPLTGNGRQILVFLLADQHVDVDALAQPGQRVLQASLERLIDAAMAGDGSRSRSILRVNAWGAMTTDVIIKPAPRKGPRPCAS